MFGPSLRKHFTLKELSIFYDDPMVFIVSQWQRDKSTPSAAYLLYRLAVVLTFVVTWLLTIAISEDSVRWPIYLTNWGYTACTVQAVLAAGMLSAAAWSARGGGGGGWPKSAGRALAAHPAYWLANTVATPIAFGITAMYWTVIYKPSEKPVSVMNVFVHAVNSVLMFCDLWVVCHPVRILHLVYPLALGLTYTVFSVIYYSAGGTGRDSPYIYPILKWDQPLKTSLICLGVVVFVVALHVITYFVYRARTRLDQRLFRPKESGPKQEPKGYDNAAMATENV